MPGPRATSRLLIVGAVALLGFALAACSDSGHGHANSGQSVSSSAAPVDGGELTYAMDQEPDCLDPHVSGLDAVSVIDRNLVDSLVAQAPDGKIVPWLAKSWKVSPNLETYTFTLRSGATFADGTPVNATAVKENFDDIANPATESHYAVSLLGPYAGTTVASPTTVQIRFKQPYAPFLQNATTTDLGLLSPRYLTEVATTRCHSVVGSGPFTFLSWTPNSSVVIKRRAGYDWAPSFSANRGPAHLAQVTFRYLPDHSVRVGALTSGQAQIIDNVPPASAKTIAADPPLQLLTAPQPGGTYTLFLKTAGGPLASEDVRLGLQHALDLDTIVAAASDGQFTRAWSEIGPTTADYDKALEGSWSYSPAQASADLNAAGWTGRDSAGYRTKDGKPLVLDWLQVSAGAQQSQVQSTVTQLVQAEAKQAGIQINADSEPVGTYLQRAYATHDYDLFASTYGGLGPDELGLAFASASRPVNGVPNGNVSLLDDPQVDGWLNVGSSTLNAAARAAAYAKVQHYVIQHAVVIPIYVPTSLDAAAGQVHGLAWDAGAFPLLQAAWLSK
jgi:peptide/nickel transport system substrate-binding protein